MLILTNCLTSVADEGCLKVVNSLVKRIQKANPTVKVASYERESELTDVFLHLNKLLLSRELISLLRSERDRVLYMPFPARKTAMALRVFLLSLWVRCPLQVLLLLKTRISPLGRFLLRCSGAEILVLSEAAAEFYGHVAGRDRVRYIRTGVDTEKFLPVTEEQVRVLKVRYGLDPEKKVVLHVGHLKQGRNVAELMKIDQACQVLLVTSTLTEKEADPVLAARLEACPNIRILREYIPRIEQIYQLSDVYFFPVLQEGNCIDVPLSCLEAASCGKPVVTTAYGEMKRFVGREGFYYLKSLEKDEINGLIAAALEDGTPDIRSAVLEYDWDRSVPCFWKG